MSHSINDWLALFPKSKPRDVQEEAINFTLDSFLNDEKKFVILELGVGCGKSAVGVTVARYLEQHDPVSRYLGAYVLTTQKVLQQQYIDDFGPGVGNGKNLMLSLKSSVNYRCNHYVEQSCAESRRVLAMFGKQLVGSTFYSTCKTNCPYVIDKLAFINSPLGITNFSYFLAETMYSKQLEARGVLVVDECHNIQNELGKFIEVTFSEKFAKEVLKCKVPALNTQEAVFEWLSTTYEESLAKYVKVISTKIKKNIESGTMINELSKQHESIDKHICKVHRFIETYEKDNWIMNIVRPSDTSKRGMRKFEFKPVDVSRFGNSMLFAFANRVLMMSATVVDKDTFCESIGVDPKDVSYLKISSPFPVENRPVHYVPVGSMSRKNIETTLPVMAQAVQMLIDQHSDEKGIIHCVSFKVAQYLMEHVKSDRLLTHTSENRDAMLTHHITNSEPTVLLSPSMMEGVDLADNASRFQILCKIPFPYLGDEVVKRRMERSKTWYSYQTVKSVIQSLGRSVRNETDYAVSYILDSDWERFYRVNKHMFPSEFASTLK